MLTFAFPPSISHQGGAISIGYGATCSIVGASFVSNTATDAVSRAAQDLESCRADLLYPWPGVLLTAPLPHRFRAACAPALLLHRFRIASSRQGGAIYNYDVGSVTIAGSTTFVNNTASQVGGYPTFRPARADSYVCRLGCFHLPHRAKTSTTATL